MKCTKAIIMAGGFGTRWLPLTKAIDKCMLPIGRRPLIDLIVDGIIKAGITDIVFRVGKEADQIRTYYGHNTLLEEYLQSASKFKELEALNHITSKATYSYSPRRGNKYGTAISAWQCRNFVEEGEKVLIVSGDQLLYNADGSSAILDFLREADHAGTSSAMLAVSVPPKDANRYGVVQCHQEGTIQIYDRIIEKPATHNTPSNLINAACYLFDKTMFNYTNPATLQSHDGEYYITDALDNYTQDGHKIAVVKTKSEYLDCGTVGGWLHANNRILGGTPA